MHVTFSQFEYNAFIWLIISSTFKQLINRCMKQISTSRKTTKVPFWFFPEVSDFFFAAAYFERFLFLDFKRLPMIKQRLWWAFVCFLGTTKKLFCSMSILFFNRRFLDNHFFFFTPFLPEKSNWPLNWTTYLHMGLKNLYLNQA